MNPAYYSFMHNGKPYDLQAETVDEVKSYLEENFRSDVYDIVQYEYVSGGKVNMMMTVDIAGIDCDKSVHWSDPSENGTYERGIGI